MSKEAHMDRSHIAAIRERTRLGMPKCTHGHPGDEEECPRCLLEWADARTIDCAFLLMALDAMTPTS